jgi:ribosomal protein L14
MQKLFSDTETFTKERPTKITESQKENLFKEIAQEIIDNDWSPDVIDSIKEDISDLFPFYDNGYEMAKRLEGFSSKAHYNIDTEFIEFLDGISYKTYTLLEDNVKQWVKAHNPQPKLRQGQKLIITKQLNHQKKDGEIIYINGINTETACYYVDKDPNRKGGTVIAFEKVEICTEPIA